jgi:Tol biopolymer transport system component
MRYAKVIAIAAAAIVLSATSAHGAASANAGKIVFEGDRSGAWGLSVMRPDGTGVVDLDAPVGAADGSWSPNGKQIAFSADVGGDIELFVMNADGTGVRQLTHSPGPDIWADWFPNGKDVAFTSFRSPSGAPNIYAVSVAGGDVRAITDETDTGSMQPAVSPNGKQILFQRSTQFEPPTIWVVNADGSNAEPLTEPGPYSDQDPAWSSDGNRIAFSSNRLGGYEIFAMDADGSDQVALTGSPGGDFNPVFSPDGHSIAWWKLRGGQGDIWVMDAAGENETNVTNSPTFEGFPDWHQGHLGA